MAQIEIEESKDQMGAVVNLLYTLLWSRGLLDYEVSRIQANRGKNPSVAIDMDTSFMPEEEARKCYSKFAASFQKWFSNTNVSHIIEFSEAERRTTIRLYGSNLRQKKLLVQLGEAFLEPYRVSDKKHDIKLTETGPDDPKKIVQKSLLLKNTRN